MQEAQGHIKGGPTPHLQGGGLPHHVGGGASGLQHVVGAHARGQQALVGVPPAGAHRQPTQLGRLSTWCCMDTGMVMSSHRPRE